jgi:hypothetical protein
MSNNSIPVSIEGRCIISDDLGNILLDKTNKIHPMNMSCIFARALSNEKNHFIHKISFGNGGTFVDASNNIIFNSPNDGSLESYKSRLYNDTYSEIIDDNSSLLSHGMGSSPSNDPLGLSNSKNGPGVVSNEIIDNDPSLNHSQVIITCVLNKNEPLSQYITQTTGNTILSEDANTVFSFDEIGIFTDGISSDIPTSGYQSAFIDTPNLFVNCGLSTDTDYDLTLKINGINHNIPISISSEDVPDNNITFIKLIKQLSKAVESVGVFCYMDNGTNTSTAYYNFLTFKNKLTGNLSSLQIVEDFTNPKWLFNNIKLFVKLNEPINGTNIGVQNNPNEPYNEFSRMLSHLIFEPITKSSDRIIIIKYIYNIYVTNAKK